MKQLAVPSSSEFSNSVEIFRTSSETLKLVAKMNSKNEFIFIQSDGSLVMQTSIQIWNHAERMLGGLRSLGLQPGNSIIFQLDTSQDFAPALWSCIMGGLIPVPVSISSDYSQPNQDLSKLDNIWQQLDYATILTTSKLASQIHTGLQLYGKKNVKIATIEEIETYSPDTRDRKSVV
jgi:acyl-CoA synthetase (AMP-forming)/AMP-acid ligase II